MILGIFPIFIENIFKISGGVAEQLGWGELPQTLESQRTKCNLLRSSI